MPKESQDVLLFLVAVFTEIPKMLGAHGTIPNLIGATFPLWAVSPFFPFTSCWDSCLPCWISKQNSTQKYHWWLTSVAQASQSLSNQLYLWTASNRPFFFPVSWNQSEDRLYIFSYWAIMFTIIFYVVMLRCLILALILIFSDGLAYNL